jgi:hypothetical protein
MDLYISLIVILAESHGIKDLHIEECQLDELWSFIKKTKTSQCIRKPSE